MTTAHQIAMSESSPLALVTEPHPAPAPPDRRTAVLRDPGFGRVFTDYMAAIRYREGRGWHDAKITARAAIPVDPAAAVLHYGQQIFEGLKAYRTADGGAVMFSPEANARRSMRWSSSTATGSPRTTATSIYGPSCSQARSSSASSRRRSTSSS